MKTAIIFCALLACFQQTQSCGSTGPTPLHIVTLPAAECGKPYTGQFVTGGSGKYNVTVGQITWTPAGGAPQNVVDLSTFALSFAQSGGARAPIASNSTVATTGYIVGTVPCTAIADPTNAPFLKPSGDVILAGMRIHIRRPS